MSAERLLPLALMTIVLSGCASPQNHEEVKSQSDKVSVVILPVMVVAPNRDANDGDSSTSRGDDSHPRVLFLRNLRTPGGAEF